MYKLRTDKYFYKELFEESQINAIKIGFNKKKTTAKKHMFISCLSLQFESALNSVFLFAKCINVTGRKMTDLKINNKIGLTNTPNMIGGQ